VDFNICIIDVCSAFVQKKEIPIKINGDTLVSTLNRNTNDYAL